MADTLKIKIEVLRYNPEQGGEPHFQTFEVPFTHDTSVLQGLQYIKDHLDGSLTFRWSCRMAICGSCGKMVNGVPVLSCHTFLRDYYPGKVRVEPLKNFPLVRDLVVEIGDFMAKLAYVKPWVIRADEKPLTEGEYRQTPEQLEAYKQYIVAETQQGGWIQTFGGGPDGDGPYALTLNNDLSDLDFGNFERIDISGTKYNDRLGDGITGEAVPFDIEGLERFADDPGTPDTGQGKAPIVDRGAHELQAPPCLADFNGDGLLNVFDFLAFQTAFSEEDESADHAPPFGVFNVFDFLAFQTAFGNGC